LAENYSFKGMSEGLEYDVRFIRSWEDKTGLDSYSTIKNNNEVLSCGIVD